jgi:hypothetical protein
MRLDLPTMRLLSESLLEHTVTAASDPSHHKEGIWRHPPHLYRHDQSIPTS